MFFMHSFTVLTRVFKGTRRFLMIRIASLIYLKKKSIHCSGPTNHTGKKGQRMRQGSRHDQGRASLAPARSAAIISLKERSIGPRWRRPIYVVRFVLSYFLRVVLFGSLQLLGTVPSNYASYSTHKRNSRSVSGGAETACFHCVTKK